MTALLEVNDVTKRFGGLTAVKGVTFTLEKGELTGILGPNGAGKTTLFNLLTGFMSPTSGTVQFNGEQLAGLAPYKIVNRGMARTFQLTRPFVGMNLLENVLVACLSPRAHGDTDKEERARHLLSQVGLGGRDREPVETLPYGDLRRLEIARALATRPDLLLLDEPFAGLDAETRDALCEDTSSALRSVAGGVLVVVHDRAEAWALADRLVVLIDGVVAASGAPGALLAAPPTAAVARFLGYDGELRRGETLTLTRPSQVLVDRAGDLPATVSRVVPLQDGVRVELELPSGSLRAWHPEPDLAPGDRVHVRLLGGVDFPA
jgi:branched-chain amino acid transport system ATP-binding protein